MGRKLNSALISCACTMCVYDNRKGICDMLHICVYTHTSGSITMERHLSTVYKHRDKGLQSFFVAILICALHQALLLEP